MSSRRSGPKCKQTNAVPGSILNLCRIDCVDSADIYIRFNDNRD